MLQALNTASASSFSKLFVSRSAIPSFFHKLFFSDSKMEEHRTSYALRGNLDAPSGRPSASPRNSSLNSKVCQSSFSTHRPRSRSPQSVESERMQTSSKKTIGASPGIGPGSEPDEGPFDICRPASVGPVKLNKSLLEMNREKRKERERAKTVQHLRTGMVLLKNFIGHMDQVQIVNKCCELGKGPGGFYRPGYRDGAKLHLQMMCLGKDWNPESRSYSTFRSLDGAVPPEIPEEFRKLVDDALNASHKFLSEKEKYVEEIPKMSPDICIVNFYSSSGRLGLHQDRDESEESIEKGLPVVSFSIGDSAEFLYSDVRDVDKAEKVILESGDVLIFGGSSRRIFHGVPSIKLNTAPGILTEKTKLRPGRLNLTFRQY